ncbi:MAG: hypothetical protein Q7R34_07495 [Dehalococcoidia bacterium]|nr:hypothetical protein [Dehalococcoidia bacterium]
MNGVRKSIRNFFAIVVVSLIRPKVNPKVLAPIPSAQRNTGNIISFEVESNWGMRKIPFSKARA